MTYAYLVLRSKAGVDVLRILRTAEPQACKYHKFMAQWRWMALRPNAAESVSKWHLEGFEHGTWAVEYDTQEAMLESLEDSELRRSLMLEV